MAVEREPNPLRRLLERIRRANDERRQREAAARAQRAQEQARREQQRRARRGETREQRRVREAREAKDAAEAKAKAEMAKISPDQAKKAKETVARKIEEDFEVSGAIGTVPQNETLAFYVSQWAEANPEIRGRKEVVDNLIKTIESTNAPESAALINKIRSYYYKFDRPPGSDQNVAPEHVIDLKPERGTTDPKVQRFADAEFKSNFEQAREEVIGLSDLPGLEKVSQDIKNKAQRAQELLRDNPNNPELARDIFSGVINDHFGVIMDRIGRGDISYTDAKPYLNVLRAASTDKRGREYSQIDYKDIADWDYKGRGRPGHPKDVVAKKLDEHGHNIGGKGAPDNPVFQFQSLTQEEVNNFKLGRAGEEEWFWGFISRKENMPRQEMQLGWTELQKLEEFFNFINWKYGPEEGLNRELVFRQHLDVRPGLHHRIKELLTDPVDEKHQIEALVVSPDEYSYLTKINELSPRAMALYEEAVRNVMMRKRLRNHELTFGNDAKGILTEKKRLARIDNLKKIAKDKGGFEKLSNAEALEYMDLWKQQSEKEYGVMLWANDIQFDADLWRMLQDRKSKQDGLLALIRNPDTPQADRSRAMQQLLEVQLTTAEEHMLHHRGKSAIDVETERLLRLDIANTYRGKDPKDKPSELDIDLAIKAARTYKILTLDALQIASSMADAPDTVKGRYRSPALERLQRIINPELFERRFEMGGAIGNRKRGYHLENIIEKKKETDPRLDEAKNPELRREIARLEKEWLAKAKAGAEKVVVERRGNIRKIKETLGIPLKTELRPGGDYGRFLDKKFRHAEATLRAYENLYGISYDEMLRGGTISIGGPFHQSTWRMEVGGYEPLIEQFQSMGKRAEHVALGFQYKVDPFKRGKEDIAKEMFERMPHLVNQYAPEKAHEALAKYKNVDAPILYDILATAQMRLSHGKDFKYQTQRVNLSDPDKFNEIVKPIMDDIATKHEFDHLYPDQRMRERLGRADVQQEYRKAIEDLVGIGHELAGSKWREIQNLPLTLTYSDMDLGREEFFRMGEQAIQRRYAADMSQAYTAMQVLNDFQGGAPELFSPNDYKESLKRLYEALKAMDGYAGRPAAEPVVAQQLDEMIAFNQFKNRGLAWIPGYRWIVRNVRPLHKARFASDSMEFTGGLGNMWDEREMYEFLNTARDLHFFDQRPDLYHDLVRKYHLGVGYRFIAAVRDNWWVLPIIMGATAVKEASEEEKKRGH